MTIHLLLVEDDDTTRFILTSLLSHADYQVTAAPDGNTAIQMLRQQPFDVVVTDIRMREVDGLAVLQAARQRTPPPEVILLTGHGSLESAIAALRLGAFHYLLKPCDSSELLACVAEAVQRRATERRLSNAMRTIVEEFTHLQATPPHGVPQSAPVPSHTPPTAQPTPNDRYVQVGELRLDRFRHTATFAAQPLHLTRTEFTLLSCLAETPGRVLNCPDIVRRTHSFETSDAEAQILLRGHVRNLRRKIPPAYLINVRSTGYMLQDPREGHAPA